MSIGVYAELEQLRTKKGMHLPTLDAVHSVLSTYAGRRATVLVGHARRDKVAQASTLIAPHLNRAKNIREIEAALGVSNSTARRYFAEIQGYKGAPK